MTICSLCSGTGAPQSLQRANRGEKCPRCGGTGEVEAMSNRHAGSFLRNQERSTDRYRMEFSREEFLAERAAGNPRPTGRVVVDTRTSEVVARGFKTALAAEAEAYSRNQRHRAECEAAE